MTTNSQELQSKTSPQFARMLRSMMLVDKVSPLRNAQYLEGKLSIERSMLSDDEKSHRIALLANDVFSPEMSAIKEYAAIKDQVEHMNQQQLDAQALNRRMPKRFIAKLEKLEQQLSMPIESFVAQYLLQTPSIRVLKQRFPGATLELKNEVRFAVKSDESLQSLHPCARHLPATVDLFKSKYPKVIEQLNENASHLPAELPFLASLSGVALGLLKSKSEHAFQDAKLNSRAFIAIALTKTFAPMVSRIEFGISEIIEKVSLKKHVKQLFSSDKMKRLQRVAMGVGLSLAALSSMQGLMSSPEVKQVAMEAHQTISEMNYAREKTATLSSVHVPGYENAPDPESVVLFSPALTGDSDHEPAYDSGFVLDPQGEDFISEEPSAYGGKYEVKAGDSLSEIIETQLEHAGVAYSYEDDIKPLYLLTAEVNLIDNPDKIKPGQVINLLPMPHSDLKEQFSPDADFQQRVENINFHSPTAPSVHGFAISETPKMR